VVLAALGLVLVGCGTNEIGGDPAGVTGETISLPAGVPACGHPEFVRYRDGVVEGEKAEPGYVAATDVDDDGTGELLLDGDLREDVSAGDVLNAVGGRLHVVSIVPAGSTVDGESSEERIVVVFVPGGGSDVGTLRSVQYAGCPQPPAAP